MGNYATTTQVKTFKISGKVVDLSDYTDTEISEEIDLAESVVEKITNDIFYVKTETNLFDGNGLLKLYFFPLISYRLISVTTLKELDLNGTTVLTTYTEDLDFKKYAYYVELAKSFAGTRPRKLFGAGGIWPKGQKNIEIVGTWGRSSVPAEIKRATILLTLVRLMPEEAMLRRIGIKEAAWDDFKIQLIEGRGKDFNLGDLTGWPEIDTLLLGHINYVDLFIALPDTKQTHDDVLVLE